MSDAPQTLRALPGEYAIALLPPDAPAPGWARGPGFVNLSFCEDELAVICLAERMPAEVGPDRGWSAFQLVGPFAFDAAGILLSVLRPVSGGGIGVLVCSTFHTDYLLVKTADRAAAVAALTAAGHRIDSGSV